MEVLGGEGISDRVLSTVNEIRAGLELSPVLNAFSEADNANVYRSVVTLALGDDFGDDTETAAVESIKELLSSDSPRRPEALSHRDALLSKFATHLDVIFNSKQTGNDEMSLRIEVYFKYLELAGVGPVIDGDLVVQGTCLSTTHSPAICKVEFAADHEESMIDAATIAPWMMMYTPSSNPNEVNSEFAVPITLGVEHREGHVRVKIYVDNTENIPYGEEKSSYIDEFMADTKGERFVCALEFTTRATSVVGGDEGGAGAATDGLAMGSVIADGDEDFVGFEGPGGFAEADAEAGTSAAVGRAKRAKKLMRRAGGEAATPLPVVVDIKIAIGYDETEALRSEGFHMSCSHLHEVGIKEEDEEGKWNYFVMAKFAEIPMVSASAGAVLNQAGDGGEEKKEGNEEEGADEAKAEAAVEQPNIELVEDIIYLEVPKDATVVEEGGDLATNLISRGFLAEGYHVFPQDLLAIAPAPSSAEEGDEPRPVPDSSIFVAYKRVSSLALPAATLGITSLGMFSFSQDVETTLLPQYLASQAGKALKLAPASLNASLGNNIVSGLLVGRDGSIDAGGEDEWIDVEDDEGVEAVEGVIEVQNSPMAFLEEKRDDVEFEDKSRVSRAGSRAQSRGSAKEEEDAEWQDASEDDNAHEAEVDEAELLERLLARVEELTTEKETLSSLNADLQRKAVVLIAREKALMQGQSRAGTAPEEAPGKEEEPQKEEHVQEREKQFSEILSHIVEGRKKASQQQLEYDQLALDLQTRLDDRNFKAGEIYESFKAFKKEILSKAENSRTSKPMSKRLIKQFEAAELQREEDLERVRLRNISMRTQLKKLERTLRAREQLAEGLYMIDFEQLKVENQTLYEKIEERSEELVKLKRKKTITVQMLTHVREKLRFVENANVQLNQELNAVENLTMARRGDVTSVKKQRDLVRDENKELRLKQGFSSSSGLKTDFDSRKGKLEDIKAEINELRERYDILQRKVLASSTSNMKK